MLSGIQFVSVLGTTSLLDIFFLQTFGCRYVQTCPDFVQLPLSFCCTDTTVFCSLCTARRVAFVWL